MYVYLSSISRISYKQNNITFSIPKCKSIKSYVYRNNSIPEKEQSSRERRKQETRSKGTTKGKRLTLSVQNETINASRRGNNFVYFVRFSGSSVGFSGNKSRLTVFICICMQCVTSFAMIYVPMVPWN